MSSGIKEVTDEQITQMELQDAIKKEQIKEEDKTDIGYTWKQTLSDVDITIKVPKGTKSKQLDIRIKQKSLFVALKGVDQVPFIIGDLSYPIKIDDSTWMIGTYIRLYRQIHTIHLDILFIITFNHITYCHYRS